MSSKQKIRRSTRRKGGGDTTDTDYTMETDVESVNAEVLSMMNVLEGDDLAPSNQGVIINECVEAGATASRHDDPLGSNVDLPGVHTPQSASRQRRDTPPHYVQKSRTTPRWGPRFTWKSVCEMPGAVKYEVIPVAEASRRPARNLIFCCNVQPDLRRTPMERRINRSQRAARCTSGRDPDVQKSR